MWGEDITRPTLSRGSTMPKFNKKPTADRSAFEAMLNAQLSAFRTGFNTLTTFNRSFRKHAGCSPSEYRSRIRVEHFGEIIL